MNELIKIVAGVIQYKGQTVATTALLAERLGATDKNLNDNYQKNKDRYEEGKHYIIVKGQELRELKSNPENFGVARIATNVNSLYLWTEKGAFNHVKSLGTDEAWDAYQNMVDQYFRLREFADAVKEKQFSQTAPVLSVEEMIIAQAQSVIEAKRRIETVEQKVLELDARTTNRPRGFTVAGWAKLQKIYVGLSTAAKLGRMATRLCKERGIRYDKVEDPRFAEVGVYPVDILEEVFAQPV